MSKWLPNVLSAARLAVSPYLCFLLWRQQYRVALLILLVAAATDGLDGYFARKLQVQSRLGEVLDPIADKILMGGAFLTLAFSSAIEPWLASVVIGRDVLILLVAAIALALGNAARRFPPSLWGKLSTAIQIAFVVALMGTLAGLLPRFPAEILKWATAAMTIWSGLHYGWMAYRTTSMIEVKP
jgi:cardiolipin synthase (CMP-forming)